MPLNREALPSIEDYCESHGLPLDGRGKWRTGPCRVHGGSDSLRCNTESNGWVCMSCGASGGDALALHQAITGLDFVDAAKGLGAWIDDGKPGPSRPAPFSARDALAVLKTDLLFITIVIGDVRRGVIPAEADWQAFTQAAGRVIRVAEVAR